MSLENHLYGIAPKHILALDGGGVRGIISLAYLERVESLLATHYGTGDKFRLCDHFSLIGGTSTGSIIATCLALGYSVSQILDIYVTMSVEAFRKPNLLGGLISPKFPSDPLMKLMGNYLGNLTLGTDKLLCGLGIITKRIDTNSVWLFHNHPRGPFYDSGVSNKDRLKFTANCDLQLLHLIRASTAAPTYFEPEFITIAPGVEGVFVDGGVSLHNNPALALFMLVTIRGYGFVWPMGEDGLHILSVGTGLVRSKLEYTFTRKTYAAKVGLQSMLSLMSECGDQVQLLMQWMGNCYKPIVIDSEIGDLANDQVGTASQFKYLRLNIELGQKWLKEQLGYDISNKTLKHISNMDQPSSVKDLLEIGRHAAEVQVDLAQLTI